MKYQTHNDLRQIDVSGTCLRGYCPEGTTYEDLVRAFGEPFGGCGKTDWEWAILFEDGTVATIYNWKDGPSYGGAGPHAERSWHIGGFYNEPEGRSVSYVAEALEQAKDPTEEMRRLWRLADEGDENARHHLENFGGRR